MSEDSPNVAAVFAYGTLKRGQCRAHLWPRPPAAIEIAWALGRLHGRSDYPAMTPGKNRVRGELWRFPLEAMPAVLATLDEVEGTNQPGEPDLYQRVVIEVFDDKSRTLGLAYAYFYAKDPRIDGFSLIEASGFDIAWPESDPANGSPVELD